MKEDSKTETRAFHWRDESNPIHLTNERAKKLVEKLIPVDGDDEAEALIELITGIAYEENFATRDDLATNVGIAAFSRTIEFFQAASAFGNKTVASSKARGRA